jgi:uncharacterized protein YegP (UPF0339 family)
MPAQNRIEVRHNRLTRRWRFNVIVANNKAVGSSQRYRSPEAVQVGIEACQRVFKASKLNVVWPDSK